MSALLAAIGLVGVWQVVDYTATDPATGEVKHPFGDNPTGSAIYTAKGHMSVFVAGSHRAGSQRAAMFDGLYAYTGSYTLSGDTVTIHIESAWQPSWVGTDKSRTVKFAHDILTIVTAPMTSPVDGKTYISTTTFKRVE